MPRKGESIYLRKDGLWEARYVKGMNEYGKKKYGSVYAHSYREVKEKRQDILCQITLLPQSVSARRMVLNTLIQEWLFINQSRIKASTYQRYLTLQINHIEKEIGTVQVIYLTPVIFKEYSDKKQKQGLSATTINAILTFINTCLKYGSRQYGLPVPNIIYLKQSVKEMRVLSIEEQKILVPYLLTDTDNYKLGVLTALYTGIRIGELCALKWEDIQNGVLRINKTMFRMSKGKGLGTEIVISEPKTYSSNRIIPLPSFLVPIIEPFRRKSNAYFLSNDKYNLVEPRVMQYYFQRYLQYLKLEKANFHALRHTFASTSVEHGFDIKSLSCVLGHSDVKTTLNRYVHSSLELKASNMEKLPVFM